MHHTIWLLVLLCQSGQDVGPLSATERPDVPRIRPFPLPRQPQTWKRPVLQDTPPTRFVPPSSSPPSSAGSSSFPSSAAPSSTPPTSAPPVTSGQPGSDSQGSFIVPGAQGVQGSTAESPSGFSPVNPSSTQPLRSSPNNVPPGSVLPGGQPSGASQVPTVENAPSSLPGGANFRSSFGDDSDPPSIQPSGVPQQPSSNGIRPGPETFRSNSGQPSASLRDNSPSTPSTLPRSGADTTSGGAGIREIHPGEPSAGRYAPVPSTPGDDRFPQSPEIQDPAPQREVIDETFDPQLKQISDLILTSVRRPGNNRVSLAEAVRGARNADHRKLIVKQYWSSFVTLADWQFAQQELQLLQSIPRPSSQLDQLLLRAAISSAQARLSEARLANEKAATGLFQLAPVFEADQPISFADLPWIGKYKTNTDEFVKVGYFDAKIRRVDTALPALRDLIYLRGAAVHDNLAALRQAIPAISGGQIKLDAVLRLHQETRDQRIAFLKNVEKYNHAIADYAITVFPNANRPQVVARMLIDTEKTLPSDTILDRNVRQASRQ